MSNLMRFVVACVTVLSSIGAGAADLVSHQGFEICWATAVNKPTFLGAMQSSIDGGTTCIPPQTGTSSGITYNACNTPNGCGVGITGCPVTIHSASFTGDFVTGAFSAPGTVNTISIPVSVVGLPITCTLTLSAIVTRYDIDYLMQMDGLDGVYTDDLAAPEATIISYTRTGCDLLGAVPPEAITAAQDAIGVGVETPLRANTVERAICPLGSP